MSKTKNLITQKGALFRAKKEKKCIPFQPQTMGMNAKNQMSSPFVIRSIYREYIQKNRKRGITQKFEKKLFFPNTQ